MQKQRSFSSKSIRFPVLSFTLFFSLLFLIFFSAWIIHTIPWRHPETPNLGFRSTDFTVQSLTEFDSTNVVNNSILVRSESGTDLNSSQIRERGVTVEESLLTGNSSLTSNISVYGVNSKVNNHFSSTDDGLVKKKSVVNTSNVVLDDSSSGKQSAVSEISFEKKNEERDRIRLGCDITEGRWMVDESYPLYTNAKCPFIDEGFNCEGNGRRDKDYLKWRWQPQDCDVSRFNATKMLELIRRKRLVFVGDSINRNQWESMLCSLMGGVKNPKKVYETHGRKITRERGNYCFRFEEYKCTVEYYVSHFLVHESKARVGSKRLQTLRIDTIDKGSSRWRGADILVFNTAHWWSHHKTKAGINYYQEGDRVHPQLDVKEAFKLSLSTWAAWVDKYINPRKTRVFFRSSAPSHFSGGLWNAGGHCKEVSRPINKTLTSIYPEKNMIVEEVISKMKTPVTFLNITRLSDYRPDAHPSIYGRKSLNPGIQDCSHWCLPGVPDTWNELLYHNLLLRRNA